MKRFQLYFLLTVLGLIAASCAGESDPEAKLDRFESAESFHVISSADGARSASAASVVDDVRYEFAFNDDERLVTFVIRNFRVTPDEQPADYTFTDVPWAYSLGTPDVRRVIDAEWLSPTSPMPAAHTLNNVHIVYYEPKESSAYESRGVLASYTVDGSFHVQAYPYTVVGEGTTVCFNAGSGRSRMCYSTAVVLKFNPGAKKSVVEIRGLLPDDNHGQVSFSLNDVVTEFVDGGYNLRLLSPVSLGNGTVVRDFRGTADMSDELLLEFGLTLADGEEYEVECHLSPNLTPQNM